MAPGASMESGRDDAVKEKYRSDSVAITWKWMPAGSYALLLFLFLLGGGLLLGFFLGLFPGFFPGLRLGHSSPSLIETREDQGPGGNEVAGWSDFSDANPDELRRVAGLSLARNEASARDQVALTLATEATEQEGTLESRRPFPVTVNRPAGSPRVATGEVDTLGRPVTVSCSSCHANLPAQPEVRAGEDLAEFHQGLKFDHGKLTCLSCHHQEDYNHLRLADGSMVEYPNVQTLCTQCHASQARDYEHGAHGGMLGYWDLTRGPRQRKGCLDCHDPHAPAFPRMFPKFKPRDRFLGDRHMEAAHD